MTLLDLPDDLLWSIVAPIFAEYVLHAFQTSYPSIPKGSSTRIFVDEMAEALKFRGIFSLLHVSGKFRDITGRLLLRAIPSTTDPQ